MARPRKNSTASPVSALTPGQASYILERLVSDRRVSAGEVARYLGDMHREISSLEERLHSLRSAASERSGAGWGRGSGRPVAATAQRGANVSRNGGRRRSPALTPEQQASRQLQGRYLGLIRQIPATRRAQYARIAKEKGREAAIKEMTSALNK